MSATKPTFKHSARRPAVRVQDPIIQWATGLQTKERRIYAGWFVEAGKLEDLDEAMARAGFPQVTIKHGSGNMVTHWAIETADLFVVAAGVQSIGEMKHTNERHGIAFGWRTLEGGRQQSVIKARVYVAQLVAAGYTDPLLLTVKSTLTGDVITALMRQYEVLDAAGGDLPLYALSLPIGPGMEVARGSGGQTKEITPPVALVPTPITEEYIAARWISQELCDRIEAQLDDTCRWSIEASAAIGAGEENDAPPQPHGEASYETPMITDGQRRALFAIWKAANWEGTVNEWIHTAYAVESMNDLTAEQASEAIETLKGHAEKAA